MSNVSSRGGDSISVMPGDAAYLYAMLGREIPEGFQGRERAIALAGRMGILGANNRHEGRFPREREVAIELEAYQIHAPLPTLHAAAEILDGYRTSGRQVRHIGLSIANVLGKTGGLLRYARGKNIGSAALRGIGNASEFVATFSEHGKETEHYDLLLAVGHYLGPATRHSAARAAPLLWESLIGRVAGLRGKRTDQLDAVLCRLALKFMASYEAGYNRTRYTSAGNNSTTRLYTAIKRRQIVTEGEQESYYELAVRLLDAHIGQSLNALQPADKAVVHALAGVIRKQTRREIFRR